MNKTARKDSRKGWSRRQLLASSISGIAAASLPGRSVFAKSHSVDVLVLGAGLSGLNAALNLEDIGYKVQILEGSNRIGGRLFTAAESEVPGYPELGGSGIGSAYARVLYTAERFGVKLEDSRPRTEPRKGELMYHVRGEGIKVDDWAEHPLNPFVKEKYRKTRLSSFQYLLYGDNPLPAGDLEAWQSGQYKDQDISVYDFLIKNGVSPQGIELGTGTNMSYGTNPHDLSMLMGYQNSNLINTLYRGENAFPARAMGAVGGNQRIPEAMANGLKSDIVMGQHVRAIRSNSDGVEVVTKEGKSYKARYCICTLPFSALRHVDIDPYLEGKQAVAVNQLGYTPVFQVHFVPTREFWLEDGLPPSMWTDQTCGRFMALKNDPSRPDKVTSYIAFVNEKMALYLDRMPEEQAVNTVLADLERIRPSTRGALKPVKVWSWNRNPFAGGAYAYWKPGQITSFSREMRDPWHRIHFAGEHTAVLARGMEGAMESGERAAFEVMERLG